MNTTHAIRAAALAACFLPTLLSARMVNYVRPIVAVAESTEDSADSGVGGFIQIGGGDDKVDLSVEGGWLIFDPSSEIEDDFSGLTHDVDLVPLLATVKWRANLDQAGKYAFLVGPSVGLSYVDVNLKYFEEGVRLDRVTDTAWTFTYGVDAALTLAPSKGFDLTVGYKFLIANGVAADDGEVRVDTGEMKMHIAYAGIGFRF